LVAQAAIAVAELDAEDAAPLLAVVASQEDSDSRAARAAAWSYQQLTGRPFTPDQLLPATSRGIERFLGGTPAMRPGAAGPDAGGNVAIGVWDPGAGRVVTATVPSGDAGVVLAARLAMAQAAAFGNRPDVARRALVLGLEAQAIRSRNGLPVDATAAAKDASPNELQDALADALDTRHSGAAAALCSTLGEWAGASTLRSPIGRPTPLAKALDAAHPAVRFAALEAVMRLNPPGPFPGSSRVAPALAYFAEGEGGRTVVVATPNTQRSATLGGRLASAGVRAEVTIRGREAVKLAAGGADVAAVFVDLAILDPPVRETIFQLRRQPASAGVPIVLTAGDGRLAEARAIAAEHVGVLATARLHSAEDAEAVLADATDLLPPDWPDADARRTHAEQARRWIADLQAAGPGFYRLPRPVDVPGPVDALTTPNAPTTPDAATTAEPTP
ncbi:MAG: hypothetical protein AAGG46_09490, partial [Planctomycetota bacterium]